MKSLTEELTEAFNAAEAAPVETPAAALPPEAATGSEAAPSEPPQQALEASTDSRARGPDGKFLKNDAAKPPSAEGAPPVTAETVAKTPVETPAATADRPPDSLTAGIKAQWASLPPEIKAEFSKREEDFHKGIAQYREGHQFGTQVYQSLSPYLPMIQAGGANPVQAISYALQQIYEFNTNPAAKIQQLAAQNGIDLSQIQAAQGQQTDPVLAQIRQENAQMRQQLGQLHQQVAQPAFDQRLKEVQAVENDPKNVYFRDVFPTMVNLIKSGEATSAQDAYDKACRVNPQVWSAIQAQQSKDADRKRIAEAQAASAKARQAALDVTGTGSAGTAKPAQTLREELESRYG